MEKRIIHNMHRAYVGVGSNLGDRLENIKGAVKLINESKSTKVCRVSKVYETEPFGYADQGLFLNCVFEVDTLLPPRELVRSLLDIEHTLKRERKIPMGPRTIDLDVLFYDDIITSYEDAVIPHPRLHERKFVLKPLCDLAPYYVHPLLNDRCDRIAENLQSTESEPILWAEEL